MAKYKPINLLPEDHALIDSLRLQLIAERGEMVSLADTVMEGVKLLENKLEGQNGR